MLLVISISCFACSDPCDVSGARRRRRGRGMAARGMNRTRAVAKASLPAPVAKAAAKVGQVATAVAASAVLVAGQAQAASLTFKEQQGLTYMQIKGTGLANTCPLLDDASDKVDVPAGEYQIEKFCLEPTGIEVREEAGGDFTPTKLMTRLTYTRTSMPVGSRQNFSIWYSPAGTSTLSEASSSRGQVLARPVPLICM